MKKYCVISGIRTENLYLALRIFVYKKSSYGTNGRCRSGKGKIFWYRHQYACAKLSYKTNNINLNIKLKIEIQNRLNTIYTFVDNVTPVFKKKGEKLNKC